jgi:GTP-binding protein
LYSQALARKPEIAVLSKAELTGSDLVREELQAAIGHDVLAVSAVTGQGMAALVNAVVHTLAEIPTGAPS